MLHIDTRKLIDKLDTNGFNCFDYRENTDGYICIDVSDDKHPNKVVVVAYNIPEEDLVVDENGIYNDYDNYHNINAITKSEIIKFDDRLKQAVAAAVNSDNNAELIVRITSEDKDITSSTTDIGTIIAGSIFDNVEWD